MNLSVQNICDWAGTNPAKRNFIEGERVFRAGHIIKCGKNSEIIGDVITAQCLQTSKLKEKPHKINGKVKESGQIVSCVCSCKAGEALETLSCTDKPCSWKKDNEHALISYQPAPFMNHSCILNPTKKIKLLKNNNSDIDKHLIAINNSSKRLSTAVILSDDQEHSIKNVILANLPDSAFTKHNIGRHSPKKYENKNFISELEKNAIKSIYKTQDNELMESIKNYEVDINPVQECCQNVLNEFNGDFQQICENTKMSFANWHEERRYRITGSICYNIYTYTKNKTADWKSKSAKMFNIKSFKSEFTEYGKVQEKFAREEYVKRTGKNVIEIGLVICKKVSWLGYSPDGIIFKDNKPVQLVEFKCPYMGKTNNIKETVDSLFKKYIVKDGENVVLKKKHSYYGQIQLGMAVLNLKSTEFVIYSSFDKNFFAIKVSIDEQFVCTMLQSIKRVYYNNILHEICLTKKALIKDDTVINESNAKQ